FALQLRRDHEFLHAVLAQGVAEMGVPEFSGPDALLLFLAATATLQRQAHGPFQRIIGDRRVRIREHELEQAVDGLLNCCRIPATQCAAKEYAALERGESALFTKMSPALREEIADQTEMVGENLRRHFGHVPTGQVGMNTILEGRVVPASQAAAARIAS